MSPTMPPPPTEGVETVLVVHDTETLVTFVVVAVPEPLVTVHVWPDGCVRTVAEYVVLLLTLVANVNDPLVDVLTLSPPLFCSTSVPERPEIVPPMVGNVIVTEAFRLPVVVETAPAAFLAHA